MKEKYDIFILLPGTYTDEQVKEAGDNVKVLVEKSGGEVILFEETIRRRLAYVIQKIRNGIYYKMRIEIEKDNVQEMRKELRMMPEILRSSILVARDYKKVEIEEEEGTTPAPAKTEAEPQDEPKAEPTEESKAEEVKSEDSKESAPEERGEVQSPSPKENGAAVNEEELDKKIDEILEDTEIK